MALCLCLLSLAQGQFSPPPAPVYNEGFDEPFNWNWIGDVQRVPFTSALTGEESMVLSLRGPGNALSGDVRGFLQDVQTVAYNDFPKGTAVRRDFYLMEGQRVCFSYAFFSVDNLLDPVPVLLGAAVTPMWAHSQPTLFFRPNEWDDYQELMPTTRGSFAIGHSVWKRWCSDSAREEGLHRFAVLLLSSAGSDVELLIEEASVEGSTKCDHNGHTYEVAPLTGVMTRNDAATQASLRGGYLATVTSQAEQNCIMTLLENNAYDRVFLGGKRVPNSVAVDDFYWETGEMFKCFHPWGMGEPNNRDGTENDIELFITGWWNDADGEHVDPRQPWDRTGFIIERGSPLDPWEC